MTTSKLLVVPMNFFLVLSFFGSLGLVSFFGRGLKSLLLLLLVVVVMLILSRSCYFFHILFFVYESRLLLQVFDVGAVTSCFP